MDEETRKERVNEKTVKERIEKVENKLDIILKSQATIMNAIGSVICMSEIKYEDIDMKNATLVNLINHRDECMKEVYGESYEELLKTMDKVVNDIGDALGKIFK